jgi:hypothetical protein
MSEYFSSSAYLNDTPPALNRVIPEKCNLLPTPIWKQQLEKQKITTLPQYANNYHHQQQQISQKTKQQYYQQQQQISQKTKQQYYQHQCQQQQLSQEIEQQYYHYQPPQSTPKQIQPFTTYCQMIGPPLFKPDPFISQLWGWK